MRIAVFYFRNFEPPSSVGVAAVPAAGFDR
jgi:hypothetical protein